MKSLVFFCLHIAPSPFLPFSFYLLYENDFSTIFSSLLNLFSTHISIRAYIININFVSIYFVVFPVVWIKCQLLCLCRFSLICDNRAKHFRFSVVVVVVAFRIFFFCYSTFSRSAFHFICFDSVGLTLK